MLLISNDNYYTFEDFNWKFKRCQRSNSKFVLWKKVFLYLLEFSTHIFFLIWIGFGIALYDCADPSLLKNTYNEMPISNFRTAKSSWRNIYKRIKQINDLLNRKKWRNSNNDTSITSWVISHDIAFEIRTFITSFVALLSFDTRLPLSCKVQWFSVSSERFDRYFVNILSIWERSKSKFFFVDQIENSSIHSKLTDKKKVKMERFRFLITIDARKCNNSNNHDKYAKWLKLCAYIEHYTSYRAAAVQCWFFVVVFMVFVNCTCNGNRML